MTVLYIKEATRATTRQNKDRLYRPSRLLVRMPNMIFKGNPDLADIVFFSTDSDAQDTIET